MQRSKLLAVVVAFVASGVAAFLLVGGASASSWHDYQGDLYAGHAYGIDVPEGAKSLELALAGDDAASAASVGVFSPEGKRLGIYDLTTLVASASIANPDAGRYVVYVYDLTGALGVRVDSETEPTLDIQTIPLTREDVTIGTFESAKLDKIVTSDLKAAPVFVTLLYEGSARALDATVASEKGDVAIIRGETGTAFSPGVWTSLKGARSFQAANLEGTIYTVNAHAERFEGTMVLSTLSIDFAVPVKPVPVPPANVTHPMPAPGWEGTMPGAFPLVEGAAIAFTASAGTLHLADPALLESTEQRDDCSFVHGLVTIYAPDDSVVAVAELNHDEPMAQIELPTDGEYVAYVARTQDGALLAHLPGQAFPALRNLELAEESFEIPASSLLVPMGEPTQIELAHVPVALGLDMSQGVSLLGRVEVSNEAGPVAYGDNLVGLGGATFTAWSAQVPENFRAGAHDVRIDGVYEGAITLLSLHYLRASEVPLVAPDEAEAHEHDEEEEEPGEPAPASPPMPPAPPAAPMAGWASIFAMLPL